MKHPLTIRLAPPVLALAALAVLSPEASAQFDAEVSQIHVTQAMQTGATPVTGARSTFVRVTTALTNPPTDPVRLDGVMRVYVNGVEVPESPVYSINGPYKARSSPNPANEDDTLNFRFLPPVANNVVLEVEINPAGPAFVPESNTANNIGATPSLHFQERAIVELAYVPIDYRPNGGGTPNLPSETLTRPGKGDNFVQGIFPVSDIEYHRTDVASKLWATPFNGSLNALLNSLAADHQLMNPAPDFLYGWLAGSAPSNGSTIFASRVAAGNTEPNRYQRTFAFLVTLNLFQSNNTALTGFLGVDVEHQLGQPQSNNLPVLKPPTLYDIRTAGKLTDEAWVEDGTYRFLFNDPFFAPGPAPVKAPAPALFVAGSWNTETGFVELSHVFDLPAGELSDPAQPHETAFLVRTYAGGDLVHELPIASGAQSDAPTALAPELPFSAVVPRGPTPIERLEITPASGVLARSLTLDRSPSAPVVGFTSVNKNTDLSSGRLRVAWSGTDADGDTLAYYVRYSSDGTRFTPLATGITVTSIEVDLTKLPAFVDGSGFFQLLASDGLNTTVVNSTPLFGSAQIYAAGGGNDPWVHVCTPDKNTVHAQGASVILHSSGWDLEDRALTGSSVVWSSDVDGPVATGRITSFAGFSVGTHQLTVTATDSDGQSSSDTVEIVVTGRSLPGSTATSIYCTAGTSASGCQAMISVTGTPSASSPSGFTLDAATVEGAKDGLFFYGTTGRKAGKWGGSSSYQCVIPPVQRAGFLSGVGTPGLCDGAFSQDLNTLWSSQPAKNPGAGAWVRAQCWYRDPLNTSNQTTSLSDAVEFPVLP